jgi:hypothetical protein
VKTSVDPLASRPASLTFVPSSVVSATRDRERSWPRDGNGCDLSAYPWIKNPLGTVLGTSLYPWIRIQVAFDIHGYFKMGMKN